MGALRFADLRMRPTEVLDLTSLTWLTDKSEACPSTLLSSVYTLFGETACQGE
jgi:hypothetical protein